MSAIRVLTVDPEGRKAFVEQGAVSVLLSLLRSDSPKTVEHAVAGLANLSMDAANDAIIVAEGALVPLVRMPSFLSLVFLCLFVFLFISSA